MVFPRTLTFRVHSLFWGSIQTATTFFVRRTAALGIQQACYLIWALGSKMCCSVWQAENKHQGAMPAWCEVGTHIVKCLVHARPGQLENHELADLLL